MTPETKVGKVIEAYPIIKNPKVYETKNVKDIENKIKLIDNEINKVKEERKLYKQGFEKGEYNYDFTVDRNFTNKIDSLENQKKDLFVLTKDSYDIFQNEADKFNNKQDFVNSLKSQGYDGIIIKNTKADAVDTVGGVNNQIVAFDPEQIVTKEQLTDIWNKAQKETTPTPTEVAKSLEQAIQSVKPSISGEFKGTIPPSGNIPPVGISEAGIIPTKERRFPSVTVKEAPSTAKGLKNIVDNTIYLYSPIKNKEEFAKAVKYVSENAVDDVISALKTTEDPVQVSYVGQALMNKLQKEGNFARASDVLDIVSESATRSGQAIQALSIWGRLTPEGALRKANDLVRKYNTDNKLVEGTQGFIKLSESKAKEITDQAKKVAKFGDDLPYEKAIEISKLQRLIASVIPAQLGEKISAVQTLAQLLNPKTFIRNVLGNAIFGSIDAVTQNFASLLDLATSLFTKKRTVAPASIQRLFSGGVEGAKMGLKEALAGADTSQLASQFDLPNASVFDSKVMQGFEKALNVTLKAPDRAFYQATYNDTLKGLMDLAKTDKPTKEMLDTAHYEGLRRTFQDPNIISDFFVANKRALNKIGIKGFGLGDLVLKYPKTPANLLVRGLEYTPAGYFTALIELARPLVGQAFDQRAFVNNLARATVGTGMLNLGYALAQQGILSPRPNSDKDARNAQDLQGLKSYSFNVSALKRYVLSGFDSEAGKPRVGDQLFSYDWAQPAVFPLAMGANIAENDGKIKDGSFADKVMLTFGPLGSELIQSSDTITEQPLLQGIKTLFSTQNLQQGLLDTVVGAAGSFVPTLLNQINQYTDNVSRETYSPDYIEAAYNKFASRIPLLAQKLPARSDVLGRTKERFPNASNTFFNVFFNPAFTDQIKADPVLAEVISIYEQTGEKTQFPRIVDKSIQVNGERKLLSTQELVDYQRSLGQLTNDLVSKTITNPEYAKLPTEEKAKLIANMISDSNKISKVKLFGDSPASLTQRTDNLLNNNQDQYIQDTLINAQKSIQRKKERSLGIVPTKIAKAKKPRKIAFKKPRKPSIKLAKIKTPKIKKLAKAKPIKFSTKI